MCARVQEDGAGRRQHLVGGNGHAHLVADTEEQQAPLRAVDGDLADQLIKTLRVQFLAHGADTGLSRLRREGGIVTRVWQGQGIRRRRKVGMRWAWKGRRAKAGSYLPPLKLLVQLLLQIDHI